MFMTQRLYVQGDLGQGSMAYVTVALGHDALFNASSGWGAIDSAAGNVLPMTVDLEEAYIEHALNDQVTILFGKKATYQGWEVLNPAGNTNISRGLLYTNTEAFTHTGAYLQIAQDGVLGEDTSAGAVVGVINGWDAMLDNNKTKTVLLRGFADGPNWSLGGNLYYGSYDAEEEQRTSIDVVGTVDVNENFSVAGQIIWGSDEFDDGSLHGVTNSEDSASWFGVGIWPTVKIDKFSFGARLEYLVDSQDYAIEREDNPGLPIDPDYEDYGDFSDDGVTYIDVALTPAYLVSDNLTFRGEVRVTSASEDVFLDEDGDATNSMTTIGLEALWTF
jgi:hypothetical protein